MNEAHVICPRCGCEIEVGNESGLRMVAPPTPGIHVLKEKDGGLDFSKFVAATKPQEREYKVSGSPVNVDENVVQEIIEDGYIKNAKHRRFVTAQMFRMLRFPGGYNEYLKKLPYAYQWDMLVGDWHHSSELKAIAHLQKADRAEFERRVYFFNVDVIVHMLDDFVRQCTDADVRGTYYKAKIQKTVAEAIGLSAILSSTNYHRYDGVLNAVRQWYGINAHIIKYVARTCSFKHSKEWIDAFKGSGAYYTMQNLVCYHNCKLHTPFGNLSGEPAVEYLDLQMRLDCKKYGYQWFGMLKEMIEQNHFAPDWN